MSNRVGIPWVLAAACVTVATAALRTDSLVPPPPAADARLVWTQVHALPDGRTRGPLGVGVQLHGLAVRGASIYAVAPGQGFRSDDGGAVWEELLGPRGLASIEFGDSGMVIAGSYQGMLFHSVDAGSTWDSIKPNDASPILGLAIAGRDAFAASRHAILRSRDAGATWQRVPLPKLTMASVAIRGRIVLASGTGGVVVRSVDGGESFATLWTDTYLPLHSLAFVDDSTVVAVGEKGTIMRSTDAGAHWTRVVSPARATLLGVAFADDKVGLAVGLWGEAVRTEDAGLTWTRERTGTDAHLQAVAPRSGGGFYAAGLREVILRGTPR